MQTIVRGREDIQRLLETEKSKELYRASRYVLKSETKDGTLLFNSLTGEVVILSPEEQAHYNALPAKLTDDLEALQIHGFIVPVTCTEGKRVEQLRNIFLKRRDTAKVITHFNILPTTACNARCFYCYESNIKHVSMTKDTADKLVRFIEEHHGDNKISISWFGGEPSLGKEQIDYICRKLDELQIRYTSQMVSNAYLFDAELVKHAKECWHLEKIQITLDGTEEVYNRTKAYVGISESAYRRVLRNIGLFLKEKIQVNVRLNMDEHNTENLNVLVDELAEHFSGEKHLAVYVRLLKENVGFDPVHHNCKEKERLEQQLIGLQQKLESKGWAQMWRFRLPSLKICCCMADDPYSIQCTPDGIFSKCEDCIYEHTIGSLTEGIIDGNEIQRWRKRKSYTGCENCILFPSCTYLLENCPTRPISCPEHEKKQRISLCLKKMNEEYIKWKNKLNI